MPQNWVGKSLVDLGVRERLGINVVGIIKNGKIEVAIKSAGAASGKRNIDRDRF